MLSGERFSDRPACVSSVVAALLRGYNDGLDGDRRQTLKRYAADAVGSADDRVSERARRKIAARGVGAAVADHGPMALVARTYVVLFPYHAARGRARRVATHGDDALHDRLCGVFDALVAGPADEQPNNPKISSVVPDSAIRG